MGILKSFFDLFKTNKSYKEILNQNKNTEIGNKLNTTNSLAIIDVTKPVQKAKQELLLNWEKFANYDDILQIDEKERYELLKDIYDNWNIHGTPEFFKEKYVNYNEKIIEQINTKEGCRLNLRLKVYHFQNQTKCKSLNSNWLTIFSGNSSIITGPGLNYNWCMCTYNDFLELNLTNDLDCFLDNNKYWGMDIISNSLGVIMKDFNYNNDVNLNDIRLYHNGELHIFSKKEFLKYKEKYNLNNLYLTKQERDKVRHQELLEIKNIQPGGN